MTNKVPNIRFKGFTDDWEQRKLGEVVSLRGRIGFRGYKESDLVAPGDGAITFSPADIDEMGNVSTENNKYLSWMKYDESPEIQVDVGDILFTKTASIGKIGYIKDLKEKATINPQFALLTPKENSNGYFTFLSVRSDSFMKQVRGITGGSSVPTMSQEKLKELVFMSPSLGEQQKIGEYFSNLDHLITLHQRKCEQTKELKKYMLQKMFPKKGEKNPEIRFPGFTDDWEQRKLSSGLREYTDRVIVEDDKEYYQISVRNNFGGITLRGSKMGNKIGRKRQAKINLTKYPQTLIFTRQTVEQGGIGWVEKYCDGAIVTENMPTISLDTSVFSKYFLTNLFQTKIFYKNAILDNIEGGSAQIAIHESKFLSSTLLFPNLDEQEKIGSFFKQIDETITLHQRKCEQLKELKKFMLQNMFPKKG